MIQQRRSAIQIFGSAITIILLCVLGNAFAYEPFMDQIDRSPSGGDFYPEDYYAIDPNTLISDLDHGLLNAFSPIAEPPDSFWSEQDNSFQWHQSDFVKIATALNQIVGKDHITDWGFQQANFNTPCKDYVDGFLSGDFVLFRPKWVSGQLYYEAREIVIDPSLSIARWGDGRIYPRPISGWSRVELDNFKITAEDALKIAEERGGKQIRLKKANNCIISVMGNGNQWTVLYSPLTIYEIDALTGRIIEIQELEAMKGG